MGLYNRVVLCQRASVIALIVVAVVSNASLAAETYGYGRGTQPASIGNLDTSVNRYLAITADAPSGATSIQLSGASLVPGDLLLLHQTTVVVDGGLAGVTLNTTNAGRYTFRRAVSQLGDGTTQLDAPLDLPLFAHGAQAVVVAEYASLTVSPDAGIAPPAWNGSVGGIVAIFVDGPIVNDGRIHADGRGYRGGESSMITAPASCNAVDAPAMSSANTAKGEGFATRTDGNTYGLGSATNGGGGGPCSNAGAGGGGHFGQGGHGGMPDTPDNRWGLGGLETTSDAFERIIFGGGGGAAGAPNSLSSSGGAGGGLVFVRARSLAGGGVLSANGASGSFALNAGASGGGAGGAVVAQLGAAPVCGAMHAQGANGTDSRNAVCSLPGKGPGGGGGGGVVLRQPGSALCPASAANGLSGVHADGCSSPNSRSALPTSIAAPYTGTVVDLPLAYAEPDAGSGLVDAGSAFDAGAPDAGTADAGAPDAGAPPSWVRPNEGDVLFTRRPRLSGVASPGQIVVLTIDGAGGRSLMCDSVGTFDLTWDIDLSEGTHSAAATAAGVTAIRLFTIDARVPDAPVIVSPAHHSVHPEAPAAFTGTGAPLSTVHLQIDEVEQALGSCDSQGRWTVIPTPALVLDAGAHTARAWVRGRNGLDSELSSAVKFTVAPRLAQDEPSSMCVGCSSSPGALSLMVVGMILRRRWARRPTH